MDMAEIKSDSVYSLDQGMLCYTQSIGMPQAFDMGRFSYSNSFPGMLRHARGGRLIIKILGSPRLSSPSAINDSFGSTSSVSFSQESSPDPVALQVDGTGTHQMVDYNDMDNSTLWKQYEFSGVVGE